ncbi:glycosyltransferase family 4 protein [Parathalassolituus penaei]|uniref:Glycosyltransferase family 1 protein n=1 Tax=Parathalassolituus penaei TaxID=2997323 RepID=A0A9X3IRV8_9GAMM|nr:glycosyltransferase family 1 protein [Parathalassolituus penaei]MCY0964239.1 glycosyltransferase family 1 protein [Parathalassolituus penaei]
MAPVRISIVTETYIPDVNGVANSLSQLLRALDRQRFRVQLVRTRPHAAWTSQEEEVWCRGIRLPFYPDVQVGWPSRERICEAWDSFTPDLVYLVTEGPLGAAALAEARQRGIPVISSFHTNFHRYSSHYGFGWVQTLMLAWLRHFHNRTALTMVPAPDMQTTLLADGFESVEILPHGVDCTLFDPRRRSQSLRQQWLADQSGPVMMYVGRLAAEKNIPLVVHSWQQLRQQHPGLQLVLVGDGPLREQLQREYPDIHFCGVKTGTELAQHFASADLFVFPSMTETFGLVTLEAMASGLPIVAFDVAAAGQYVSSGCNGELAKAGDEWAFVDSVRRLLAQDLVAAGRLSRQQAELLGWKRVAEQFEAYSRQVLVAHATKSVGQSQSMV